MTNIVARRAASIIGGIALLTGASIGTLVWIRGRESPDTSRARPSIAVLEFRVIGTDIEPWSGRGLAQEIRAALDSMEHFRATHVEVREDASADYLVSGTVARRGARSEIGIEVLRALDRVHVWTGTYWREQDQLEAFGREIAEAIVLALRRENAVPSAAKASVP